MNSLPKPAGTNNATIWTYPDHAVISGPIEPIAHLLFHAGTAFTMAPDGGLQADLAVREFWSGDFHGRDVVHLGLIQPVRRAWIAAGVAVEIRTGKELPVHLTAAIVNTLAPDGTTDAFACSLADNFHGQIEVGGVRDMIHRIVAIRRALPTEPILLVATSKGQAHDLRHRLQKATRQPVYFGIARGLPETWISVNPMLYPLAPEHYRIVLVCAHDLGREKMLDVLGETFIKTPKRRYAFVFRNEPLDALQRHTALALFGPVIWHIGDAPRNHVTVLACDMSFPAPPRLSGLALKRAAIWHNDARNRTIASVAAAVMKGDLNALMTKGIIADATLFASPPEGWLQAMVLVESPEHGRRLQRYLPGWPLMDLVPGKSATTRAKNAAPINAAVVTLSWANRFGFPCQVLLRADAGVATSIADFGTTDTSSTSNTANISDTKTNATSTTTAITATTATDISDISDISDITSLTDASCTDAAMEHLEKSRSLVLIDFNDAGDTQHGLHQRLEEYRRQGWTLSDTPVTPAALATKPPRNPERPRRRVNGVPATASVPDERRPAPPPRPVPSSPSRSCKVASFTINGHKQQKGVSA